MKGFTLAEVLIATVLVCIVAMGALSVAVTGRMGPGRMSRRAAAAMSVQRLSETLKNFVAADTLTVAGPGGAPANGWSLPGDACSCNALSSGAHTLDPKLWLSQLSAAPYNGTIGYTVVNAATANGPEPTVTFSVGWTEP